MSKILEKWNKLWGGSKGTGEIKTKPTIDEAIAAWEDDQTRNPEGFKIVRGADGKPVEMIYIRNGEYAIIVNKEKKTFNEDEFDVTLGALMFKHFVHNNVFDQYYELKGASEFEEAKKLNTQHVGFVYGFPTETPDNFPVTFKP